MNNLFARTEQLLGRDGMKKLNKSTVAVFGIGGVGSYTVEALARSGVGRLVLFDDDVVCESNINRQLIATSKTIGQKKVDVARERAIEINPDIEVVVNSVFYSSENADKYDFADYSYIVDAIDTVSSKIILIEKAKEKNIPIISCMGAGNKLDPTQFEVSDISETSVCPLARVMRCELRRRGINHLKVVYSKEPALMCGTSGVMPELADRGVKPKRQAPGSVSFVPSVAGLIIAGEVIKDIIIE